MIDYVCPRCAFTTHKKSNIQNHFYKRKNPCPATEHDIELTDEIKQHVVKNHIYKIPVQKESPQCDTTPPTQRRPGLAGYIYAILLREFMRMEESVIKVGRAEDVCKRFICYPKGSRLLYTCYVDDVIAAESKLLTSMREEFISRRDVGKEYFEGRIQSMILHIQQTVELPSNYV